MSNITHYIVPFISLFFSAFLFLSVLSAKKNRAIRAFLVLLGSFVLWTAGSLFMRMQVYPSALFWYYVSATGIFCVPFAIYYFIRCYTGRSGGAALICWAVLWIVTVALNLFDVFVVSPSLSADAATGDTVFSYSLSWTAIFPVLLAVATLYAVVRMIIHSVRKDGVSLSTYMPLIVGTLIMFLGIVIMSLFKSNNASDTIFCCINVVCVYYALYKKRLITLTPIASNAPVYLMSIGFAALMSVIIYPVVDRLFSNSFPGLMNEKIFIYSLLFAVLTIIIFALLHKLMGKIFIKGREERERQLRDLSGEIGKTLDINGTAACFIEFIRTNTDCEQVILLLPEGDYYTVVSPSDQLVVPSFSIKKDHPLVQWLEKQEKSSDMKEFSSAQEFRTMWESEKHQLEMTKARLLLPVICTGRLMGIALLSGKNRNRQYGTAEREFLESAAAIVGIAFKNAMLYRQLEVEARRDSLTGLFNRGYFLTRAEELFGLSKHDNCTFVLISFDDFRLYNELYGMANGDEALKRFAQILSSLTGTRGAIARYGGKEFAAMLPFIDERKAQGMVSQCRELFNSYFTSEAVGNKPLTISAGICGYPSGGGNFSELMSYADIAVYSAKRNGKNRTVVYSPSMGKEKSAEGQNCDSTIYALAAAIDAKDHYTFNHSRNVSRYATILARAIGLDEEHIEIIRQAGLLHDTGKIGIPESILTKTGKLTNEEYRIMQQHVEGAIAMIRFLPSLDYVIPTVIGHHERWDGKGYPRGLKMQEIPVGARCLCLADTFDAMTTKRSYRDALSVDVAIQEIEDNLGTQFDPDLGRVFIRLVRNEEITLEEPEKSPA